jgi:hypothetical protein
MTTKRAMVTAIARIVVDNEEGNGNGNKSNGNGQRWLANGNKVGGQTTGTRAAAAATATMWVMGRAMRLGGHKERKGKGGKGKCNGNEGGGH